MAFRCPDAEVVGTVRLENYRLAFRSNGGGRGVATILPEKGSYVDGVLWRISARDEQYLRASDGKQIPVMAYTMNAPYRNTPALPSWEYLNGIVIGCRQHGIDPWPVLEAVQVLREARRKIPVRKKQDRER